MEDEKTLSLENTLPAGESEQAPPPVPLAPMPPSVGDISVSAPEILTVDKGAPAGGGDNETPPASYGEQLKASLGSFSGSLGVANTVRGYYSRGWKAVEDYFDVEPAVASEVDCNEALRRDVERLMRFREERISSSEKEAAQVKSDTVAAKRTYEEASTVVLEEYDRTAIAKMMFDEINSAVEKDSRTVGDLFRSEMQTFGYQSKILLSLTLNVEALRHKLFTGKAFIKELLALHQEVEQSNDVLLVTEPLKSVASSGIKTPDWLTLVGHEAAESIERALATHSSGQVAQSLFSAAKFDLSKFDENNRKKSQPSATRDYAMELSELVSQRDYREAISLANDALKRLPVGTAATEEAIAAVHRFKESAVPFVLAHQLNDYCEASLTTTRYSFVEHFLDEIAKEADRRERGQQGQH